jgi:hypothetical protein
MAAVAIPPTAGEQPMTVFRLSLAIASLPTIALPIPASCWMVLLVPLFNVRAGKPISINTFRQVVTGGAVVGVAFPEGPHTVGASPDERL